MTGPDTADLIARASASARAALGGDATIGDLHRLEGGVSGLTFAATMTAADGPVPIVLKVAPPGLPAVGHRDVLRQARVLRAIVGTPGFPVPRVYFHDVGDPPLFGMHRASGQCWEPRTNLIADPPGASVVGGRARAAARALQGLHRVDPARVVPDEPVVSLAGELERWRALLATVDDAIAPGHDEVHARLAAAIPSDVAPRIGHGDYRLGNLVFDGVELTAVIDWEIWSVGDPRIDLAWLLTHADPAHRFFTGREPQAAADGMPGVEALLAEYGGPPPADLDWFLAFSQYKIAATLAALVKRNRRAAAPDPAISTVGATLPAVLDRARRHLDRSSR